MSLYGALFTGVSGLAAQGQKIGIISDNIANVNTVGYKKAEAHFETLVVNQFGSSAYSPGGAIATSRYQIDQQGLLSTTAVPTDVAISGGGFFVVSAEADGTTGGAKVYTRAGSFRQDENGDFRNASGYYLQGWPITVDGLKPGEPGNVNTTPSTNIDSLETVNVENSSGVASPTKTIELGANLRAGEEVYPGSSVTATMDTNSEVNYNIEGDDILAPDEASLTNPNFGLSTPNGLTRGDKFTISSVNGLLYDYEYGGITVGRDVTTAGTNNIGDNLFDLSPLNFGAGDVVVTNASNIVTVTATAHGLTSGDNVNISGVTWAGAAGIPLTEVNQQQTITVTGANTYTFAVSTPSAANDAGAGTGNWTDRLYASSGNILDASTAVQAFFSTSTPNDYTTSSLSFSITTPTAGTATFTYTASSPSATSGQFNNLTNLAEAINAQTGLSSRVADGRLMVGSSESSEAITFANIDGTGTSTLLGVDWVGELGLSDISTGLRRFSTLDGLASLVNSDTGVSAEVVSTTDGANLIMNVDDPLDTVTFADYLGPIVAMSNNPISVPTAVAGPVTVTITHSGHGLAVGDNVTLSGLTSVGGLTAAEIDATHTVTNIIDANTFEVVVNSAAGTVITVGGGAVGIIQDANKGSILAELGIVSSLAGGTYVRGDSGPLGPEYDASGVTGKNMASGDIVAQFTKTTRIYDALGAAHDVGFSFIKIDTNEWAVEVYASDSTEVSTSLSDGQLVVGTIRFNGDGSLQTISPALSSPITVNWTNGSISSLIDLGLGTEQVITGVSGGTNLSFTDGLTQFESEEYKDVFVNQDGSPIGELISVTIDENGFVNASYDNGESKVLYQLPVADFSDPNSLSPLSGNVFAQTRGSGGVNLRDAGDSGSGTFVSNALEQSNVDLATELTDMIVAQRAYQANTKVISTADELLEQLNQL